MDSWKEIAAYLKRGVSTVQRWEQEEGLPVHRHVHGKGGSVYAYRDEVDQWLAGRRAKLRSGDNAGPLRRREFAVVGGVIALLAAVISWMPQRSENVASEPARVPAPAVADPNAVDAFVKGRYFRDRRMAGGCIAAKPLYERAIALAPAFAQPHADLAFCYGFDRLQGRLSAGDAASLAWRAGEQALALDPLLVDAHVALALVAHRIDYDWATAEERLLRALRIDESHADALVFYGELLYSSHRDADGLAMLRRALAMQPLHLGHNVGLGFALYNLRRFDAAAEHLTQTAVLDPNWAKTRFWLAESHAAAGARDAAIKEYLAWLRLTLRPERIAPVTLRLMQVFDRDGLDAFWKEELAIAEEETADRGSVWQAHDAYSSWPYMMARRYARTGDQAHAIDALGAAYEQRSHLLVFMDREPLFDSLRSHRQYRRLLEQVGFQGPAKRGERGAQPSLGAASLERRRTASP